MCTGVNDIFTGTTAVPAKVNFGAGRTQSDRPLSQLPPDLGVLGNPGFCGEFFWDNNQALTDGPTSEISSLTEQGKGGNEL